MFRSYAILVILPLLQLFQCERCFAQSDLPSDTTLAFKYLSAGDSLLQTPDRLQGLEYYHRAYRILNNAGYVHGVISVQVKIIDYYINSNAAQSADSLVNRILPVATENLGHRHHLLARLYRQLGIIHGKFYNNIQQALDFQFKALECTDELTDRKSRSERASILGYIGFIQQLLGDNNSAKMYLEEAIQIKIALHDSLHASLDFDYRNLGGVEKMRGNYATAERLYLKSIEVVEKNSGANHSILADRYKSLANLYVTQGRNALALRYLNRAHVILNNQPGTNPLHLAGIYQQVATLHAIENRLPAADSCYVKAMLLYKQVLPHNHNQVASLYRIRSRYHMSAENWQLAKEDATEALEIYQNMKPPNPSDIADCISLLGMVADHDEQFDYAIELYGQALNILIDQDQKAHSKVSRLHYLTAGTYQNKKDFESALISIKLARTQLEQIQLLSPLYVECYNMEIQVLKDVFDREPGNDIAVEMLRVANEGIDKLFELLRFQEQGDQSFWIEQLYDLFDLGVYACHYLFRSTENIEYFLNGLAISEQSKSIQLRVHLAGIKAMQYGGVSDIELKREKELKSGLVDLKLKKSDLLSKKKPIKKQINTIDSILLLKNIEFDGFIKHLENKYPKYYYLKFNNKKLNDESINNILNKYDIFIEYFITDNTIYSFAANTDTFILYNSKIDSNFQAAINTYRNSLSGSGDPTIDTAFLDAANTIYKRLLYPALRVFPETGNLLIAPDGPLSSIPFESLVQYKGYEAGWSFLLKDYTMTYTFGVSTFQHTESPASIDYIGFAPDYNTNSTHSIGGSLLSPLHHNVEEVRIGAELFDGLAFNNQGATKSMFDSIAQNALIIHLAAHGLIDYNDIMNSSIFFVSDSHADNQLKLQQLYATQLAAKLVILSACNSGVGEWKKGEGILSLARGFRYAGASNLVMSLWMLNDATTSDLINVYLKRIKNGENMSDALRNAKLTYLQKSDALKQHPRYWASLIYVGENSPLKNSEISIWLSIVGLTILILLVYLIIRYFN